MHSKILQELTELKTKFEEIQKIITDDIQPIAQKVMDNVDKDYKYTEEEKKVQAETEDIVAEIYEFINYIYN
jgi:aspartate-semialdehyde dehydrogenase